MCVVAVLTEQSKAISFTFMVKYSRSIFVLKIGLFLWLRPVGLGKQLTEITMMWEVAPFSTKAGCSIILPIVIALSSIWWIIAPIQSPTYARRQPVPSEWRSLSLELITNSGLGADDVQHWLPVTGEGCCWQADLPSLQC